MKPHAPDSSMPSYDLSERLSDHQLSQAWAYLWQDDPQQPIPQCLKHLSQSEWYLVRGILEYEQNLRDQLPLQ
jgi:hypothetical protein